MARFHGPGVVTPGLLLYLDAANIKSYTSNATVWTDLTLRKQNATLANGPTYNSDAGGCIVFDGTNDRSNIAHNTYYVSTTGYTISAWFNFSVINTGEVALLRKSEAYQLGFQAANTIRCLVYTSGGINGWTSGNDVTYNFLTNNWYNMTMTWNQSNLRIYVNNVQVKVATVTGTGFDNRSAALQIGYADSLGYAGLNGKYSCLLFYNRALSIEELNRNYNALRGRFGV